MTHSKECEGDRTNSTGTLFCTGTQEVGPSGWCGACERSTLRVGEAADLPCVTLAALQPLKPTTRTHEERLDSRTAPHPCAAYVHYALCNRTTCLIHAFISFHFISFHFISFISFHFISFHFISFHFISFHFISFTCRHGAQCHSDARGLQVRVVSDTCSCVPRALGVRVSVLDVVTSFPRKGNEAQAVTSSGADAAPIPKGKNPSRTGPTSTHPAVPPSCGGPPSAKAVPTRIPDRLHSVPD